jgi:hypothetical protein
MRPAGDFSNLARGKQLVVAEASACTKPV